MNRSLVAIALSWRSWTFGARTSTAAPPPDAVAQEASRHFERGIKLSEEEDWPAALVELDRAYSVYPNYRVLLQRRAMQVRDARLPGRAGTPFSGTCKTAATSVPADRKAQVTSDIELLKGRVATIRLSSKLTGPTSGSTTSSSGRPHSPRPSWSAWAGGKITIGKGGAVSATRYVDLAGEEVAEITLDPEAPGRAPSSPFVPLSTKPPSPDAQVSSGSRLPAWIAFGVGAVGVGAGTYFGVTAMGDKNSLDRQCVDKSCPAASQSLINASQRDSLVSTIAFGVGAAGVAGGVAYLALVPASKSARPTTSRVGLFVGVTSVGAAGSF